MWACRQWGGRELVVLCAAAWSESLFDQLAFCERSPLTASALVCSAICSPPVSPAEVWRGERWRPPIFGIDRLPPNWDPDIPARLARRGLDQYLALGECWPEQLGAALVFRFGYFTGFAPERIALMQRWEQQGALFLNLCHEPV